MRAGAHQGAADRGALHSGHRRRPLSSVILAIIATEFREPRDRARAMSSYVFVSVAGGSLGLLPGGALTELLSWHWIFFVNVHRRDHRRPRPGTDPARRARRHHRAHRLAGIPAGHRLSDERHLRDRSGKRARLGIELGPRLRRSRRRADGRLRDTRGPDHESDHAVANPAGPRAVSSSVVRGFLVTGMYSTFFLGTLYLEHILHYGAAGDGTRVPALDDDGRALSLGSPPGWSPVRPHARTRRRNAVGHRGPRPAHDRRPSHDLLPDIFFAYFAIGLGIGSAFMPLLTIAMADVPAADAGLGRGSSTCPSRSPGRSGSRSSRRSRPTAPTRGGRPSPARRIASGRLSPRIHDRRSKRCDRRPRRAHSARAPRPAEAELVAEHEPIAPQELVLELERQAA